MDIDLYGFTFSNFVKIFKEQYRIDSNTYDYMSFLQQVDPGSYVVLVLTYNNPNEVLNSQLTSTLNNINVVSGENGQTGGVNYNVYAMIFLMFILCANAVFTGEKMSRAISELHVADVTQLKALAENEKSQQPIESTYSSPGYFYGRYSITPEQKARYDSDFARWKSRQDIAYSAIAEYHEEQSITQGAANAQSETQRIKAQTKQQQTYTADSLQFQLFKAYDDIVHLTATNSEMKGILKGVLGTLTAISVGGFGIFAFLSMRNRRNPYQYDQLQHRDNRQGYPEHDQDLVIPEHRRLGYGGRGGKTHRRNRNHKKRHTKRRR